jgi:hypothetical protein
MDREQIIQWAREAGATFDMNGENHCFETKEELEAFVKLVAAHEREACAKLVDLESKLIGKELQSAAAIRARK